MRAAGELLPPGGWVVGQGCVAGCLVWPLLVWCGCCAALALCGHSSCSSCDDVHLTLCWPQRPRLQRPCSTTSRTGARLK